MSTRARCDVPWSSLLLALASALAFGCGASGSGPGGGGHGDGGLQSDSAGDGGGGQGDGPGSVTDGHSPFDPDAFWAQDPPPAWCGPDGGTTWTPPGGTPDCPDDKNRQGCPCTSAGSTAACWPGLRANRGLGQCKDGTTTCISNDAFGLVWGPCEGYVLPDPTATKGKAACKCFSGGQWKLNNLSPCFVSWDNYVTYYAVSTLNSTGQCPSISGSPPPAKPTESWSTDTIKTDCAGHFKLCFALKAGSAASPQATDCELVKVCTEADYITANVDQAFPDLPAWTTTATTCATQFATTGGYGEMSVIGESWGCDAVDDGSGQPYVFNRVQYCPLCCNQGTCSGTQCANCSQGGSGNF
jgi:hypothetical protein